jgi:hypothetical protein
MSELSLIREGIQKLESEGARFLKILYEMNVKLHEENEALKEEIKKLQMKAR